MEHRLTAGDEDSSTSSSRNGRSSSLQLVEGAPPDGPEEAMSSAWPGVAGRSYGLSVLASTCLAKDAAA